MRRGLGLSITALVLLRVAAIACTGNDPVGGNSDKPAGDESGPCFTDKTCRAGLTCISDRCVRNPTTSDASTSPDGSSTSGEDAAGGTNDGGPPITPPGPCEKDAPCSLLNLIAWYRADRGVRDNQGAVTRWEDQSDHGYHAVLMAADTPPTFHASSPFFDGGPRVEFDGPVVGTPERLVTAPFKEKFNTATIYIVFSRNDDTRGAHTIIDGLFKDTAHTMAFANNDERIEVYMRTVELLPLPNMTIPPNTTTLLEAVFDGPLSQLRLNDQGTGGETTPRDFDGLTIGSSRADGGERLNFSGSIAELIVYSGTQLPADRSKVLSWLHSRHGAF